MLDEMEQAIRRLNNSSLSSWSVQQLPLLRDYYRRDLERIYSSQEYPHIVRILSEEFIERIQWLIDGLGVGEVGDGLLKYPYWRCYHHALLTGQLYDLELKRYHSAKKLADLFLKDSYLCEPVADYKQARYAYALSKGPLPDWFYAGSVIGWLEEIVTAYVFLWFAVMDYAEELSNNALNAKGA